MFVFYNWPFPQVYFAKKVGILFSLSILGSVFSDCIIFYGDTLSGHNAMQNIKCSLPSQMFLCLWGLCTTARCSLQLEMLSLLDTSVSCAKMAINWSRSCLWCGLTETQGTMYHTGTQIIHEKRHFRGDVLGHTKNGSQRGSTHIDFE